MTLSPIRWQSSLLDTIRALSQANRPLPATTPPPLPPPTTLPPLLPAASRPPLLPSLTQPTWPTQPTFYTAPAALPTPPAADPKQVANEIYSDVSKGKSIDAIAEDRGMTRDEVIQALGGKTAPEVTPAESNNGDVQTTVITNDDGRTVTEYIDYHHGTHYTTVSEGGKTTTSPVRNEAEETQQRSYDSKTGVSTRTEVDDLGTGVKTVTTQYSNGTRVDTTINPDGSTKTVVTGENGKPTELAPSQTAPGLPGPNGAGDAAAKNTSSSAKQFEDGKSIDDIATSRGLTPEQVVAELEAAGYTVKYEKTSVGQVVTLTDSKTGAETKYTRDFDHGAGSVTVTNANGTQTSRSADGNGRTSTSETNTKTGESTTKIVDPKSNTNTQIDVDKYGRRIEVNTVKTGDGKEQVTTATTANGHTLTVGPDGKITLTNNDTGASLPIEPKSENAAIARSLIDANPNSGDANEAKEGKVTVAFATSVLAGEALPGLQTDATNAGQTTKTAIDTHGVANPQNPNGPKLPGVPAQPQNKDGVTDPIGRQPKDVRIPMGETWEPINLNGQWTWVHPKVAEAIGNERIALAKVTETKSLIDKSNADLNRYLLDPEYDQAVKDARSGINEGLAPLGLEWNVTKPKGTLADAIELQTAANSAYESAGKARDDYERAATLQAQAIEKRATMPHYPDGTTPVATAADSDYNYDLEVKKGNAAWGEVNALSAEADAAYKSGDKNLTDLMVTSNGSVAPPSGTSAPSDKPVEIKVGDDTLLVSADVAKAYGEKGITALTESNGSVGVQVGDKTIQVSPDVAKAYTEQGISALTESTKPIGVQVDITHSDGTVTTEWRWVEPQLAFLKIESDGAVKLSQAYATYYGEASRLADFEVQKTELANEAIANQKELAPHQFDPEGFTDLEGDHSGKLQSVNVFDRDGQLVLEIQYEDKKIEIRVTADPGDKSASDAARNGSLADRWRTLRADSTISGNQCVSSPYAGVEQAKIGVNDILNDRVESNIGDLDKQIQGLTVESQQAINKYGLGSTEPPAGTLAPGQVPVSIPIGDGKEIKVSPEVKQLYDTQGLSALVASGKPVWIEITGSGPDKCVANEGRWVDPHVATLQIQLAEMNQGRQKLVDMQGALQGEIDHSEMLLSRPDLLGGRPDADWEYLESNEQLALDGLVQPKMQSLLKAGYDNEYTTVTSDGQLDDMVNKAIGLGASDGEARNEVTDEIRNVGGDNPQVRMVPMFYIPEGGSMTQTALFAVKGEDGATKYIDANGQSFDGLEDFQDNNRMFAEGGKLVVAKDFDMTPGADGKIALDVVEARNVSVMDKIVDPVVGIVGGVATIASFIPVLTPVAAPIAVGSGVYLGGRAAYKQIDYLNHGGEWGDRESVMNIATVGTTALPMFAGGLRTWGMMRAGMPGAQAARANVGAMRMQTSTVTVGGRSMTFQASPYANAASSYTRTAGGLNMAAHTLDGTAIAIGVPMIAATGVDLFANGKDMSGIELASAITNLGSGVVGTGMGVRGIANYRPGSRTTADPTGDGRGGTVITPDAIIMPGRGGDEPPAVLEFVNGQWQASNKNYSGPSATTMYPDGGSGPVVRFADENGQSFEAPIVGPAPDNVGSIYVPKAGERTLSVDSPALAGKSHVVVHAPDTGNALVLPLVVSSDGVVPLTLQSSKQISPSASQPKELSAGHQPKMIEASPASTYTYVQVNNMRGRPRYEAGEVFVGELNRGTGQHHYPVAADPTGPNPITGTGGRYVDVHVVNTATGRIYAIEVKTYVRYRTVDGKPVFNTVPLSKEIQQQINKDIALRNSQPGYEPQWVFLGAPPSPELQMALDNAGFVANIWHPPGKPPKAGASNEPVTPTPQPTGDTTGSPRQSNGPIHLASNNGGDTRGPFVVNADGVTTRRTFVGDTSGEISIGDPATGVPPPTASALPAGNPPPRQLLPGTGKASGDPSTSQPAASGSAPVRPVRASGNVNPRGSFIVDPQGVTSRRVFVGDPSGQISLAHPGGPAATNPAPAQTPTNPAPAQAAPNPQPAQAVHNTGKPSNKPPVSQSSAHVPPSGKIPGPLTAKELEALSLDETQALTDPQIEQIPGRELGLVDPGKFRRFTPDQFMAMSGQWPSLSVLQLSAFRKAHAGTMTPAQKGAADLVQQHADAREIKNFVEIFGPMAGTSYVMWETLPPVVTGTAAGVAFLWRGVTFGLQSFFPNATAGTTRFGRFLNGAAGLSFIPSSPGAADAFLSNGSTIYDNVSNGTFTGGNSIFAVKGVMDALTRRSNFSLPADYIGNGAYLVGSAALTVGSLHSPWTAAAGVLFTVGSAEFLASAYAKRKGFGRSNPTTPEEVAAAEKSSKGWSRADRIALGGTFGVGMLIFGVGKLISVYADDDKPVDPPASDPSQPVDDGTDQPTTPPDPTTPPRPSEPRPDRQVIVNAEDGLNVRKHPSDSDEIVAILRPDSYVMQTGAPSTSGSQSWVPVQGYGADGKLHTGWVAESYVAPHPEGSSTARGRINPDLEQEGFEWVEVRSGQTFGGIAHQNNRNTAQTVSLNLGHIDDPALIFEGDRIYLPLA